MAEIVSLEEMRPHEVGHQICRACGNIEVVVAPAEAPERMACSSCGKMTAEWATERERDLIEQRAQIIRVMESDRSFIVEIHDGYGRSVNLAGEKVSEAARSLLGERLVAISAALVKTTKETGG